MDQNEESEIETEVLFTNCPEGRICPAVIRVSSLHGETAIVGRIAAGPEAAALDKHVGPGEAVVILPDEIFDMIRKGTL